LVEHFNSYEKAAELIDNGDVSCLWTDKDWDGNKWSDCKYQVLTYKMRGEDCPPRLDATLGKYLADGEEYAYLFANGEWVCYDTRDWRDTYKQKIEIKTPVAA